MADAEGFIMDWLMTNRQAITLKDIEKRGCDSCKGASHAATEVVYLNSKCHPGAGLCVAFYSGLLFIVCNECSRRMAAIKVAEA